MLNLLLIGITSRDTNNSRSTFNLFHPNPTGKDFSYPYYTAPREKKLLQNAK